MKTIVELAELYNTDKKMIINTLFGNNPIIYLPIAKEKYPISIIITAYKTDKYIEQCLDSIENQSYFINNDNYEILIGIDGCEATLEKVLSIRQKYRNLRVFMMDKNMGTYVTSNTLVTLTKHNHILRFDSDDWMFQQMVNEIMSNNEDSNLTRFYFINYFEETKETKRVNHFAEGVVLYTRKLFDALGGYKNWKCGCDSDFRFRAATLMKERKIIKPLFYRRIHNASLTRCAEYGLTSELRLHYKELMRAEKEIKNNNFVTNTYKEL